MPYLDDVLYTPHAIQRMDERGITVLDVERVLANGHIIEEYETGEERRYLILGGSTPPPHSRGTETRPLHVVAADQAIGRTIVITAYDPRQGPGSWGDDFRTRRPENNG